MAARHSGSAARCSTLVLVGATSLALLAACDRWLTKPSLYNTVDVLATRRNGEAVPGVNLTLYTGPRPMGYGTTGADGRFTFTRVPQGGYGVAADVPPGYDVIENLAGGPSSLLHDHLSISGDTRTTVHFTFLKRAAGSVAVRVLGTDGTPLGSVPVTLYSPTKPQDSSTTDANGRATFDRVPFGVYGTGITRPHLYRDFRTPGDSLYAVRDNIFVEDGIQDSVDFRLPRCAGTIVVSVLDAATGAPVPATTVVFYTATERLSLTATQADGTASFGPAACGTEHGALITPAPNYTVAEGRGVRFFDGITVTNGATTKVVFHVQRRP
jgi:hypothetical protein